MVNLDPARPTGWFVPPDDLDALADVLVTVVNEPAERADAAPTPRRRTPGRAVVGRLVPRFEAVYAQASNATDAAEAEEARRASA